MTINDQAADALPDTATGRGLNQLEIWKPPTDGIRGYFDVTVLDDHGVPPSSIIKESTPWKMRFDVWLEGEIWKCVSGTLCFDAYFERANDGFRTSLSEITGSAVELDFKGCDEYRAGRVHLTKVVDVPAGELPAADGKPGIYDWSAVVTYLDPCRDPGVLSGFDKDCLQIWSG